MRTSASGALSYCRCLASARSPCGRKSPRPTPINESPLSALSVRLWVHNIPNYRFGRGLGENRLMLARWLSNHTPPEGEHELALLNRAFEPLSASERVARALELLPGTHVLT